MWVLDHLQLADDTSLLDDWDEKLCSLVREFGRVCERRKLKVNVGKGHYRDSVRVGIGSLPADGGKMVERLYEGFLAWGGGWWGRARRRKCDWRLVYEGIFLPYGCQSIGMSLWWLREWMWSGMSHIYILHSWFTSISDPMWHLDHSIERLTYVIWEETASQNYHR